MAKHCAKDFSTIRTFKMGWLENVCLLEDLARFCTQQKTVDLLAPVVLRGGTLVHCVLETFLITPHTLPHASECVDILTKATITWRIAVNTPS